ncbi:hypothetical protein ACNAN0_00185 [Agrilactobacillus fermenti]|uniref:hypothetical protein n=1 Tax=Agrilactobacillus fermenti TaxID=2586909 RepID=UPI001E5141CC|nr:hypothetical protein [Agrilactobacillus fermenti]MCD2256134.1 hypothetical protein [Agrilactobacillus fermenti]
MKDISYGQLLKFELQTRGNLNLGAYIKNDTSYEAALMAQQLPATDLWHSNAEMVHDYDAILNNPLIAHWLLKEVGFSLLALDLSYQQKVQFYKHQTNFFVKAIMLLVEDETTSLSRKNFTLLKAALKNSAKLKVSLQG